jgi:segregation and condensation protein A
VVNGPPVGEVVSPVTVTIDEQIELIKQKLSQRRQIRFRQLLSEATTRVEIIVTLLAVLELIKQDQITVKQEKLFGAIILEESPEATFFAAPTTESAA